MPIFKSITIIKSSVRCPLVLSSERFIASAMEGIYVFVCNITSHSILLLLHCLGISLTLPSSLPQILSTFPGHDITFETSLLHRYITYTSQFIASGSFYLSGHDIETSLLRYIAYTSQFIAPGPFYLSGARHYLRDYTVCGRWFKFQQQDLHLF